MHDATQRFIVHRTKGIQTEKPLFRARHRETPHYSFLFAPLRLGLKLLSEFRNLPTAFGSGILKAIYVTKARVFVLLGNRNGCWQ